MTTGLADRLRRETDSLHRAAERAPFIAALLAGRLTRPAYAAMLLDLRDLYGALEPALARHAEHPAIAPFSFPALARREALAADVASLDSATSLASPRPAAGLYVARLQALDAAGDGQHLLAHAYVRYLGDLSGGQLLSGAVVGSADLGGVGTAFYAFGDRAATASLARAFRTGLDEALVDDPDHVVAEAQQAFRWHQQWFDELAAAAGIDETGSIRPGNPEAAGG